MRGSTLLEFAIAWPIMLLLVLGAVQLSILAVEDYSARAAAVAGARAGSATGGTTQGAEAMAVNALNPSLVGVRAVAYCASDDHAAPPPLWVCAESSPTEVTVTIGGTVPTIIPLLRLARGVDLTAQATIRREVFQP